MAFIDWYYRTAFRLVGLWARQGSPDAQLRLGYLYYTGKGVALDYAEAANWVRKAADQGLVFAQNNLAYMYYTGQGVPLDRSEAAEWFRKAANQGDPDAQIKLGVMYGDGEGMPQDHVLAHMWLTLAASRYAGAGADKDNAATRARDLFASKMTPDQIAKAQELAREWKPVIRPKMLHPPK